MQTLSYFFEPIKQRRAVILDIVNAFRDLRQHPVPAGPLAGKMSERHQDCLTLPFIDGQDMRMCFHGLSQILNR